MPDDETFDVVVLGSGAAGCSAAVSAAQGGLRVLLLEKADVLGGGTTYSYGAVWLGFDPYTENHGPGDQAFEEAVAYLSFACAETLPRASLERFIHRSSWAMRLLQGFGVSLKPSKFVPDHYFPVAPGSKDAGRIYSAPMFRVADLGELSGSLGISPYVPTGLTWDEAIAWGGMTDDSNWDHALVESRRTNGDCRGFGMGLAGHLLAACQRAGVTIRTGCAGLGLILENGRIAGIRSLTNGIESQIRANKGVVLATGGAEGNHSFVRRFEDLPAWHTHFPPTVTGDGILMALEIGAALERSPHNLRVMLGYHLGSPENGRHFRSAGIREAAAPHTVIVNYRGDRFGDESAFQYMVNEIKRFDVSTHSFINFPCFLLMDSQFFEKYSFAGRKMGSVAPNWLPRSESVQGLAEMLGIQPEGLQGTIDRFNADAEAGEDRQFGRGISPFSHVMGNTRSPAKYKNLGPLSKRPYYGVPLIPTGISSVSLVVSADGAVLDNRGRELRGLYACGNAARDVDGGPGYQAGLSHSQGMTMGCTIGAALAAMPIGHS